MAEHYNREGSIGDRSARLPRTGLLRAGVAALTGLAMVSCGRADERACAVPTPWYLDADGDGHGGRDAVVFACEHPDGHSADSDDCDDSTALRAPGLVESCDGVDNDCNGAVDDLPGGGTWYVDQDGDGFGDPDVATAGCNSGGDRVKEGTDCDDQDAGIGPGAPETCDGIDQDCDGVVDNDAVDQVLWYVDADADGYGGGAAAAQGCGPFEGQASAHGDCDDGDPAVHPGAVEWCNGVDDDCDGVVDPDASVDATAWYPDADGDGYGADGAGGAACDLPGDSVAVGGDCDDAQWRVNPGAVEVCNDVDDDCDGITDTDAAEASTLFRDADGDGYGDSSRAMRSCDSAPGWTEDDADCDDSDDSVSPVQDERCDNGVDDDCDGTADGWPCALALDGVGARIVGTTAGGRLGSALATGCDSDGDGVSEVMVGAPWQARALAQTGAAFLLRGPHTAASLPADADAALVGTVTGGQAGAALAGAGDVNQDGFDDLLIGAPNEASVSHGSEGAAYLFLGPRTGSGTMSDADATIRGATRNAMVGWSVAGAGDVDGDGWPDVVVGAPGAAYDTEGDVGVALLFRGPVTGSFDLFDDAWLQIVGGAVDGLAGYALTGRVDHDGDGIDDVVVSAAEASLDPEARNGAVYALGSLTEGMASTADAGAILRGDTSSDYLGAGLCSPGDVDGDGLDDLLIGATRADGGAFNGGAVYLVRGPLTTSGSISTVATATLLGASPGDVLGTAMDSAGDMDGDGLIDLILGAPDRQSGAIELAGAAILLYGPFAGSSIAEERGLLLTGALAEDYAGTAVAGAGDVDGDGVPDLLVGAPGDSTGGYLAGALWFVSGAGL